MIFSKLHTSFEQYSEFAKDADSFIINTAKNNGLNVVETFNFSAKNYPNITLMMPNISHECVIQYLNPHYVIKHLKLHSSDFIDLIEYLKTLDISKYPNHYELILNYLISRV